MKPPIPLEELLQAESAWVEWKKAGDPMAIVAKLVAFANDVTDSGKGGWVICGVEETKDEHGVVRPNVVGVSQSDLDKLSGKVTSACAQHVSPPIVPSVYQHEAPSDPSRLVLFFHVRVTGQVHAHDTKQGNKVWVLLNSQTHEAKPELLRDLQSRRGVIPPFLNRLAYDSYRRRFATMDDIYMTAADEFKRQAKLPRPMAEYFSPDERIDATSPPLCAEHEIAPGQTAVIPTNLAILLFGHEPTRFIPGAYAIVSVYPGTDRTGVHSARFEFTDCTTKTINDVISKLKGYMGVSMDKSRSALEIRQNRSRYSDEAVQEAVMNAFAHRDYENHEPLRITVFSDRIEVGSPGTVPQGLDIDRIRNGQSVGSHWRNVGLSGFLRRMQLGVQAEGQGIPKIFQETVETAERPPIYEIDAMQVKITLPAYEPPPPSPRAPPRSPIGPAETELRDGIVLISIGGPSLRSQVEHAQLRLGLDKCDIVTDLSITDYVPAEPDAWGETARLVRAAIEPYINDPTRPRLHLFYRGPNIIGPVIGAAVAGAKPLVVYSYFDGAYERAYTLDRRLLRAGK